MFRRLSRSFALPSCRPKLDGTSEVARVTAAQGTMQNSNASSILTDLLGLHAQIHNAAGDNRLNAEATCLTDQGVAFAARI